MHLQPGTLLQGGRYQICEVLAQGGFGITYLALQSGLNRKVAVKEFFMKEFCNREEDTLSVSAPSVGSRDMVEKFRAKFIKEAQVIAEMDNNHIVRIHDIFEENSTAYYVMEYLSGGCLNDRIPSGGFPENDALIYIRQICDALVYIHEEKKILHLDVKPANALFRSNGDAVLIDFGISKHYDDEGGGQTSSTPVGVSRGYAPLEQYKKGGVSQFSPATDIYSLGATLYKLLTGKTPPDADEVYEDGLPQMPSSLSPSVIMAVEKAMTPRRKDRPQSVREFLEILDAGGSREENRLKKKVSAEGLLDESDESTCIIRDAASDVVVMASFHDGVLRIGNIKYPMIEVQGGTFEMGDGGILSNKRRHTVTLDGYHMGAYPVTQELWEAVMGNNPSNFPGPKRPVDKVSWVDCQDFIRKLNELTGQDFRLPTEAEWEYAAKGGGKGRSSRYSGSDFLDEVGWYDDNSRNQTHDVGLKRPNELGLYDMSGNVWEWCSDRYGPYGRESQRNPQGADDGHNRVLRGGSWYSLGWHCDVHCRDEHSPGHSRDNMGFRLAL